MTFFVSLGKMIFLFSENMILFYRRKMKDDLSQKKIHGNIIYSYYKYYKCSEKVVFPKNLH